MTVVGKLIGFTSESYNNKEGELKKFTSAFILVNDHGKDTKKPCAGSEVTTVKATTKKADKFLAELQTYPLGSEVVVTASYFGGSIAYDGWSSLAK